jgi:deoxyuridine 5'-triphosphate nucleotidohydrolase
MSRIVKFIKYKKLVPEAKAPYQKYETDGGFDLTAVSKFECEKYVEYGIGLAFEIPVGMIGLIFPRSSVTEEDLILKNAVGVIDSWYRGEVRCRFYGTNVVHYSIGTEKFVDYGNNKYEVGERVAQIIFIPIPPVKLIEAQELSETERGSQGFGHTGK